MPNKDTYHESAVAASLAPQVFTATTNGSGISVLGFKSALLIVNTGAIAGDGDFTASVQESDDDSAYTDVAATDLLGTLPETLDGSASYRVGYIGKRKFARAVITKNSGTSIAANASFVLQGPAIAPLA
ncbi:hypothetical protein [Hyphomicrobium sp. MC1]|uniref:hypothetical protein n=1 Tax=Hyphomicrobium sp. (strain MC1) TaxID=717785 RepID=UPI000213EB20|nr:hypothetical protein [Hyphomicrobium sp. MC1]CCB65387.1 conserved protein of unknown function [Hyphomicrobium sp. MC1]